MPRSTDPTLAMRERAQQLPGVTSGVSCNQSSFRVGTTAFFFVGPGVKGIGYKAMFKLEASRAEAEGLAADEPERYEVGGTAWVTVRFTAERPMPKRRWEAWLRESHELSLSKGKQPLRKKA